MSPAAASDVIGARRCSSDYPPRSIGPFRHDSTIAASTATRDARIAITVASASLRRAFDPGQRDARVRGFFSGNRAAHSATRAMRGNRVSAFLACFAGGPPMAAMVLR
jgi:hypothetical protein